MAIARERYQERGNPVPWPIFQSDLSYALSIKHERVVMSPEKRVVNKLENPSMVSASHLVQKQQF